MHVQLAEPLGSLSGRDSIVVRRRENQRRAKHVVDDR